VFCVEQVWIRGPCAFPVETGTDAGAGDETDRWTRPLVLVLALELATVTGAETGRGCHPQLPQTRQLC